MPIFFGYKPGKKATNLVHDTQQGSFEPAEPSKIKAFAATEIHSPLSRLIYSLLGHLVAVITYPVGYYLAYVSTGARVRPPPSDLHFPLPLPGLAFALKVGQALSDALHQELESRGFTNIVYQKSTVYLKEVGTKEDFIWVDSEVPNVQAAGMVPSQYLNPSQFRGFLVFRNVAVNICRVMSYLAKPSPKRLDLTAYLKNSVVDGYQSVLDYDPELDISQAIPAEVIFKETDTHKKLKDGSRPMRFMEKYKDVFSGIALGLEYSSPNAFIHATTFDNLSVSYIESSSANALTGSGVYFKFEPRLALPDTQLPGDIIGRYFLTCLGATVEEQMENLNDIKTGLGGMRLTETSDAYTHLFKCIEIAIGCEAGCTPVFSHGFYEGCVVLGGPGATINISGTSHVFLDQDSLRQDLITSSTHALALKYISELIPAKRGEILAIKSMYALREICVVTPVTPDDINSIITRARDLRFSSQQWTVSPKNLKLALSLMVDLSQLDEDYPISADALFSKDPTVIALSVFGDSVPSWEIPSGTLQSLSVEAPPNPPTAANMKSTAAGAINDAAWVMQVRKVRLSDAVDSFKRMAKAGGYRTVTSAIARKQGYYVFQRGRMIEFWNELKAAFRSINPEISSSKDEDSKKRAQEKAQSEQPAKKMRL